MSSSRSQIDPIRMQRIREMSQTGMSIEAMARRLNCSTKTVERYRKKAGVARPPNTPVRPEEIDQARLMLEGGASYTEVARTLGRSRRVFSRKLPGYAWSRQEVGQYGALQRWVFRNGLGGT